MILDEPDSGVDIDALKLIGNELGKAIEEFGSSALLSNTARARAYPQLRRTSPDANLTHEAAIGKLAEEDLYYLMSRKMSEQEATSMMTRGFLDVETPGFPPLLRHEINRIIAMSLEEKVL